MYIEKTMQNQEDKTVEDIVDELMVGQRTIEEI